MNFKQFKHQLSRPYFSTQELRLHFSNTYKDHLHYRTKENKIIKLRNQRYLFADATITQSLRFELANKLYSPSYISLESSLSYHGIIPEGVRVTTSITTKKTREIKTPKGTFLYQSVKPEMFHSYKVITAGDRSTTIAMLAKTVLDYLYLHHEITSPEDFKALRWNRNVLSESYTVSQLPKIARKYANKATENRVNLLLTYLNA